MSIDLDWLQLSALTDHLIASLNRTLKNSERPSFLGPITITGFDFGTNPPDVELVDVRDIYRDFLEDENESERSESSYESETEDEIWKAGSNLNMDDGLRMEMRTPSTTGRGTGRDEEEFEWISRRGSGRALAEHGPGYHPFPPHVRYGGAAGTGTSSASNILVSGTPLEFGRRWQGMTLTGEGVANLRRSSETGSQWASAQDTKPSPAISGTRSKISTKEIPSIDAIMASAATPSQAHPSTIPPPRVVRAADTENDLQFHLRVVWSADLRISITTSLLLNYPSALFMALPIRLTIVGFEFNGEVVVAYQPSQKRVHVCVLDDEDPYRPASASTSAEREQDDPLHMHNRSPYEKEKVSPGERLLPHIFIESEIGQADKQVLRNVSKVERFIQDMMRSTLEEELVFPNYHTVVYGDDESTS